MRLAVCLDERQGLLFMGRRQSRDRVVGQQLSLLAGNGPVWMDEYSAKVYPLPNSRVCEDFLQQAGPGELCFVERQDVRPFAHRVEELTVFWWGRHYPSDVVFPLEAFTGRMRLVERQELVGHSHDKITREVYRL